jgi:PKHD-type hydroxylase C-terminal domain
VRGIWSFTPIEPAPGAAGQAPCARRRDCLDPELVRNNDDWQILLYLDIAIRGIRDVNPGDPSIFSITDIYHNLPGDGSTPELVMAGTGF